MMQLHTKQLHGTPLQSRPSPCERLRVLGTSRGGAQGSVGATRAAAARRPGGSYRVALCAPLRGPEGLWGPSCLAAAKLAQAELNRGRGIAGRPCELHLVDSSSAASGVGEQLALLAERDEIDAIVGMCISSVRQDIVASVRGALPFVYTCLYEGGDHSPGLFAIGETAARQLPPSIAWLAHRRGVRRWMLVGNDYVWPRVSHGIARKAIAASGASVVGETFMPLGSSDHSHVLERLRATRADALLLSMVGQDSIDFNRAFGRLGLHRHVLRLSCAIEENQLLAIGRDNTEDLFVALGYFEALTTDANLAFKERYVARFGQRAPALNSIGQSLYEGMHFLSALCEDRESARVTGYTSARDDAGAAPIYLAQADGYAFRVLERFAS
jgi:urea transport system substrate-binding protein